MKGVSSTPRSTGSGAGDKVGAIFIAGFMGSGKSTIGRAMAQWLDWRFADLDDEIERRAGKSIPAIFETSGEDGFRNCEHEALVEQARLAAAGPPVVLALGGGTYAFPRNRQLMRRTGPSIWLDAAPEVLWERVRDQAHRPLAQEHEAFCQLHASRLDSYSKADCRIDASGPPGEVLKRILKLGWVKRLIADG